MPVDKNMPILIVDDYKTMLRIIRNLLRQIGFEAVTEATTGSEAFDKLREFDATGTPFGMVISDWNMEPMSGLELLEKTRADADLKKTPFIMITAESRSETVIAAKRAGVSEYIVKPFNAITLKNKIVSVLGEF